jgi:hypothetical protein
MLRRVASERGEWAGIPMPLEGERLVIEPSYPHAHALMALCGEADDPVNEEAERELAGATVRSRFWSMHKRSEICIIERADGSITWGLVPGANHLGFDLRTLGCSEAWGIEQESNALNLLASLIPHRHFKQYMLTGMFLESSKRSGVTYLFRRLKPTVAIHNVDGRAKIMCALCMHPIGHYAGTWAGAMTPSDDVVAHLQLMRGDEAMFWRRSTQHPSWVPQAGL